MPIRILDAMNSEFELSEIYDAEFDASNSGFNRQLSIHPLKEVYSATITGRRTRVELIIEYQDQIAGFFSYPLPIVVPAFQD
jgi:hypothetical protein